MVEKVTGPFKHGNCWYVRFLGCLPFLPIFGSKIWSILRWSPSLCIHALQGTRSELQMDFSAVPKETSPRKVMGCWDVHGMLGCWSWDVGMFMGCWDVHGMLGCSWDVGMLDDVGHGMLGCWDVLNANNPVVGLVFRFGFGEIPMFVGRTSTDLIFWSKLALVNRFQTKGEKTSLWLHTTTMCWLISSVHRMNSCSIMPFRIFVYLCNRSLDVFSCFPSSLPCR